MQFGWRCAKRAELNFAFFRIVSSECHGIVNLNGEIAFPNRNTWWFEIQRYQDITLIEGNLRTDDDDI